jgi:hypothetical protein
VDSAVTVSVAEMGEEFKENFVFRNLATDYLRVQIGSINTFEE